MTWIPVAWSWLGDNSAQLLTLLAGVAALAGGLQVRQIVRSRDEQSRPYVVIDMRAVGSSGLVEIYVRNFGATLARDIRLSSDPPLVATSSDDPTDWKFQMFETLPMLVPGQEWSTIWEDVAANRYASELPLRHTVTVTYRNAQGRSLAPTICVLDWEAHRWRMFRVQRDVHDLVEEVTKARKVVETFRDGKAGMAVNIRDADARDHRRQEALRDQVSRFRKRQQAAGEIPPAPEPEPVNPLRSLANRLARLVSKMR